MPEPKIVTRQEIIEFILEQDPDKKIDFAEEDGEHYCGCLMVQYGREKLNLSDFYCTVTNWMSSKSVTFGTIKASSNYEWTFKTWGTYHTTYKTLQNRIRKELKNNR